MSIGQIIGSIVGLIVMNCVFPAFVFGLALAVSIRDTHYNLKIRVIADCLVRKIFH